MEYKSIVRGVFKERPNRFIAYVEINGKIEICHVKNTGRCKELLVPNAEVLLEKAENKDRKTGYDLVSVYKGDRLINMDSQAPNKIAREYLENNLDGLIRLRSEVIFGNSRFDFCAETESGLLYIEVKGVTLETENIAMFPDAPTERGVKHINELIKCTAEGYAAMLLFVIQMNGVNKMMPNRNTHPAFADAMEMAQEAGVEIKAIDCIVTETAVTAKDTVKVVL